MSSLRGGGLRAQAAVVAAAEAEERELKDLQRRRKEIDERLAALVDAEGATGGGYGTSAGGGADVHSLNSQAVLTRLFRATHHQCLHE